MIEERLTWEFASSGIREQLRIRNKPGDYFGPPPKFHGFEREMLDREPPYDETVAAVMDALRDLGTCRQVGMELGSIPWPAIREYVALKGYNGAAADIMTDAILHADSIFLAEHAKKATKS